MEAIPVSERDRILAAIGETPKREVFACVSPRLQGLLFGLWGCDAGGAAGAVDHTALESMLSEKTASDFGVGLAESASVARACIDWVVGALARERVTAGTMAALLRGLCRPVPGRGHRETPPIVSDLLTGLRRELGSGYLGLVKQIWGNLGFDIQGADAKYAVLQSLPNERESANTIAFIGSLFAAEPLESTEDGPQYTLMDAADRIRDLVLASPAGSAVVEEAFTFSTEAGSRALMLTALMAIALEQKRQGAPIFDVSAKFVREVSDFSRSLETTAAAGDARRLAYLRNLHLHVAVLSPRMFADIMTEYVTDRKLRTSSVTSAIESNLGFGALNAMSTADPVSRERVAKAFGALLRIARDGDAIARSLLTLGDGRAGAELLSQALDGDLRVLGPRVAADIRAKLGGR